MLFCIFAASGWDVASLGCLLWRVGGWAALPFWYLCSRVVNPGSAKVITGHLHLAGSSAHSLEFYNRGGVLNLLGKWQKRGSCLLS